MSSITYGKEHTTATAKPLANPKRRPANHSQAPRRHVRMAPAAAPIAPGINQMYGWIDNQTLHPVKLNHTSAKCTAGFLLGHRQRASPPPPRVIHTVRRICEGTEESIPKQVDHAVIAARVAVMHVVQLATPTKPARTLQPGVPQVIVLVYVSVRYKRDENRRRKAQEWRKGEYRSQKRDQYNRRDRIVGRQTAFDGAVLGCHQMPRRVNAVMIENMSTLKETPPHSVSKPPMQHGL